jgi:hypothetical protein
VPGIGHRKFGNCGNRLWKDLEVAVQSGSGKVAVGGRCAAVGMVWPDLAGREKWPWKGLAVAVQRSGKGRGGPLRGQVTLILHSFSLQILANAELRISDAQLTLTQGLVIRSFPPSLSPM